MTRDSYRPGLRMSWVCFQRSEDAWRLRITTFIQILKPLYIHLALDSSTIIIIQVPNHKQHHHHADAYRLFQVRSALSLTPRTYPSNHKGRTPITPTKLPLYPQMASI